MAAGAYPQNRLAGAALVRVVASAALCAVACGPPPTYSEHIAPILQSKCQSCHRPGQIAPMSLVSYEDAFTYAGLIGVSVEMGNMPPFYAAGPPGYFRNDIRLTSRETDLIHDWIAEGALDN